MVNRLGQIILLTEEHQKRTFETENKSDNMSALYVIGFHLIENS